MKTYVSFANDDFSLEPSDDEPLGRDAAEFFIEELSLRGIASIYADFEDFYAHRFTCLVERRTFDLTIGFVGDEQLLLTSKSRIPRVFHWIGINDESEHRLLLQNVDDILNEHGFDNVEWWTPKEW